MTKIDTNLKLKNASKIIKKIKKNVLTKKTCCAKINNVPGKHREQEKSTLKSKQYPLRTKR